MSDAASASSTGAGTPARVMHRDDLLTVLRPGMRIRLTRQMPRLTKSLESSTEGVILRVGQQKTGSWFAHSKDKKLWIDRIELRKGDGELVTCNLDQYSHVDVLELPAEDAG